MSKVKRPKLSRYPKRPKASASLDAWKKFDARCKDTERKNSDKMSTYNKKVNGLSSDKKAKEAIIKKTSGMSGIAKLRNRGKRGRR